MRAVAEVAFVDGGQQGVKNRRSRLPDFIEKDDFSFREIACR
uniref:Uncharacterized protein n=1 Tax=Citrobacter sp. JSA TaxID=595547 RepID=B9A9U8_9ENTR|nr:hypothetical protein [Citrobacter sp. JSA]